MTEPGDNSSGTGRLRASHADRERVIEVLQDAFVQGRLNHGELDARMGQAFASRTYAELAALTADIPATPTDAPAPARPRARTQNRAPVNRTARDVAIGLVIGLIVAVVIVFGGFLKYGAFGVLAIPIVAVVPLVLIGNAADKRHSRSQLPRPGQGAQVLEGQRDGGTVGRDSAQPGGRLDQTRPDQNRSDLRTHGSPAWRARPLIPIASALDPWLGPVP